MRLSYFNNETLHAMVQIILLSLTPCFSRHSVQSFHALIPIAFLADKDSLMCCIVPMGRQIAKMFYTIN